MKRSIMLSVVLATVAGAATTSTWELGGYQEFLKGRMSGLSLTREGRLTLGPKLETVYASDQAQIWSLAQAADGSTYLGTGNRGRLFKVDAAGNGSAVWSAEESSIFAVAVDRAGVVYAGTSPDGKVYRIQNGRATEYFNPGERYIWALALAPDGALYVATGQQGKIYKVTAAGRGEVYYETGQAHVTALAFDAQGRLLAGSEPNGILYRVTGAPARGFVLYDSSLPEIRTILPMPDGTIYAAALGGSIARRTAAAATSTTSATPLVTAPGTSITVTDAQAGLVAAPKPEPAKTAASSANISAPAAVTEVSGVEHAALYKILPDNTVETLWSSKEENLYDIAAETGGTLALLTDVQGRVYRLDPRADRTHEAMLIAQTNETDAARLAISPRGLLVAAGNTGRLLRLDAAAGASGWFESPVHDAGTVARWGRLTWVGGSGVSYKTRSGNSVRPDATWSDWSDAITDPAKAVIGSPNARYIQWRAELNGAGAELESATIAFLPQNTPPVIRSISVSAQASSTPKNASAGTSSTFSVTVTDSPDASTAAGTAAQMIARPSGQQIYITWQADDPEGDRLSYSLFFRGEGERDWKLLRDGLTEAVYLIDGDSLADGRYFFRVVASDRLSNPAQQAKQSAMVGPPVLIDSTPPEVRPAAPRRNGTALELDVDAEDRASALRRFEYSVDASPWSPVEAADGVTDSLRERFQIRISNFPAGEHQIVLRAYDAAGNAGLAKVVVR